MSFSVVDTVEVVSLLQKRSVKISLMSTVYFNILVVFQEKKYSILVETFPKHLVPALFSITHFICFKRQLTENC